VPVELERLGPGERGKMAAKEEYRRAIRQAIQEQLKLQLQEPLHPLAGQNEAI
jgi:hypothetical protein